MKRCWRNASITCFFLLNFACSQPSLDLTTVRMAVGGQSQFIYLPLTLSDRLGYFKDEGIHVEISDLRGVSEALAAMIGGSVHMVTVFYAHTIRARAQQKHLVMVTSSVRYSVMVLMDFKQHLH